MTRVNVTVDGTRYEDDVPSRTLLVHYLREQLGKVGTVVGCDTSNCGACTVLMTDPDGVARGVKSCTVLTAQADGREVTTVEGLSGRGGGRPADGAGPDGAGPDGAGDHPLQRAFHEQHALQCGYCTPGMIMAAVDLLNEIPDPSDQQVREGLEGNLCRCTGYQNIVTAVQAAAAELRGRRTEPSPAPAATQPVGVSGP